MLEIAKAEPVRSSVAAGESWLLVPIRQSRSLEAGQSGLWGRERGWGLTPGQSQDVHLVEPPSTEPSLGLPLTKWPEPTRLETRTKESTVRASVRVGNPGA